MSLTKYQEATVEHIKSVFENQRAYIVADEVGLGKTYIAIGLLEKQYKRIIYIASNPQIANQNVAKLCKNIKGLEHINDGIDRMSMLTATSEKEKKYLVSLSPATSFTGIGSPFGTKDEREYYLAYDGKEYSGKIADIVDRNNDADRAKLVDVCFNEIRRLKDEFNKRNFFSRTYSDDIEQIFAYIECDVDLKKNWDTSDEESIKYACNKNILDLIYKLLNSEDRNYGLDNLKTRMISEIRRICNNRFINDYQPDLIILDEFHRFHTLIKNDVNKDVSSYIQYNLWDIVSQKDDCKILLLSATPYKYNNNKVIHLYSDDASSNGRYKEDEPFENFLSLVNYINLLNGRETKNTIPDIDTIYKTVMCRTQRNWLTNTSYNMVPVKSQIKPKSVVTHINQIKKYWDNKKLTYSDFSSYYDEAYDYERFYIRYENDSILEGKEFDEIECPYVYPHYKLDKLIEDALPEGAEYYLWVPAVLNDEITNFGKTIVFAHYRLSTASIAAWISMEAERRLKKVIGNEEVIEKIRINDCVIDYLFKGYEYDNLRDKLKEAIETFFSTAYARLVLTAYAINKKMNKNSSCLICRYCQEMKWHLMLDEYINISEDKGEAFINNLVKVLRWRSEDFTRVSIRNENGSSLYSCSYGERYYDDILDGNSTKNFIYSEYSRKAKRLEAIRERFQSPLYPFVMSASESAQEGVDLHNYCDQIIHWSMPSNLSVYTQEEGRVDRRNSLAIRKQLYSIAIAQPKKKKYVCYSELIKDISNIFGSNKGFYDLYPYWYLPTNKKFPLKRGFYYIPIGKEENEFELLKNSVTEYITFGIRDENGKRLEGDKLRSLCPALETKYY